LAIKPFDYSADSPLLSKTFSEYVRAKMGPFNAPAYHEKTVVFIDTIIFSSDLRYCAVWAIEKCLMKNMMVEFILLFGTLQRIQ
jgi:hypothetical protein